MNYTINLITKNQTSLLNILIWVAVIGTSVIVVLLFPKEFESLVWWASSEVLTALGWLQRV